MALGIVYDKPPLESCHDPSIAQVIGFFGRLSKAMNPGAHNVEYFWWMKVRP